MHEHSVFIVIRAEVLRFLQSKSRMAELHQTREHTSVRNDPVHGLFLSSFTDSSEVHSRCVQQAIPVDIFQMV